VGPRPTITLLYIFSSASFFPPSLSLPAHILNEDR
jgi:hypothetical protein